MSEPTIISDVRITKDEHTIVVSSVDVSNLIGTDNLITPYEVYSDLRYSDKLAALTGVVGPVEITTNISKCYNVVEVCAYIKEELGL